MPFAPEVVFDIDLQGLVSFIKSWRKFAFGLLSTKTGFSHSKKCWTGVSSSLEISFLFLSSTALSGQLLINEWYLRRNASFL